MPQMFPLNWIFLPSFFILSLIILFSFLYFIFLQPLSSSESNKKMTNHSWQW